MKLDEPLPKAAIFHLFVVLPVMMAVFMAIVALAIAAWFDADSVPIGLLLVAMSFAILANGLRALLSCVDWFEARLRKNRVAN